MRATASSTGRLTSQPSATVDTRPLEAVLRQLQSDLAHVNRLSMMGELAASLAHEVKQPIAAARINADAALNFLERTPPALAEVTEALRRIVGNTGRAGDIIDRIRGLIRKAPPPKDRLEINGLIREVIELSRGEAVKNGVSVQTQFAEKLPLIEGDRVQLQQVVLNLIVNAVEAMDAVPDGARELLITTSQAESHGVLVAVKDSGPGLTPTSVMRAFEPFYTTKPGGMGMGLSICRSIVEAHGGRLWVTSDVPRGTTFHFIVRGHLNRCQPPNRDASLRAAMPRVRR